MDDTLVLTSEADLKACAFVADLAAKLLPKVDKTKLLSDWHVRFVAAPWDQAMQVPVAEWRARHWLAALIEQGMDCPEVAADLQQCFDQTRIELFRFEPHVKEMVAKMRLDGLKTIIITNGHAEIQRTKLVACGAANLFDGILVGGEEVLAGRAEKPDPSIFQAACKLAGCKPHQACHIGDSLVTDIAGGTASGLRATIWVNRKGSPLPASGPQPSFVVQHVTELAELLPRISAQTPGHS